MYNIIIIAEIYNDIINDLKEIIKYTQQNEYSMITSLIINDIDLQCERIKNNIKEEEEKRKNQEKEREKALKDIDDYKKILHDSFVEANNGIKLETKRVEFDNKFSKDTDYYTYIIPNKYKKYNISKEELENNIISCLQSKKNLKENNKNVLKKPTEEDYSKLGYIKIELFRLY